MPASSELHLLKLTRAQSDSVRCVTSCDPLFRQKRVDDLAESAVEDPKAGLRLTEVRRGSGDQEGRVGVACGS